MSTPTLLPVTRATMSATRPSALASGLAPQGLHHMVWMRYMTNAAAGGIIPREISEP